MPQYRAPGVYVEEIPPAVRPIAGVGTNTAGFVGWVTDGVVMPAAPGATPAQEAVRGTEEAVRGAVEDVHAARFATARALVVAQAAEQAMKDAGAATGPVRDKSTPTAEALTAAVTAVQAAGQPAALAQVAVQTAGAATARARESVGKVTKQAAEAQPLADAGATTAGQDAATATARADADSSPAVALAAKAAQDRKKAADTDAAAAATAARAAGTADGLAQKAATAAENAAKAAGEAAAKIDAAAAMLRAEVQDTQDEPAPLTAAVKTALDDAQTAATTAADAAKTADDSLGKLVDAVGKAAKAAIAAALAARRPLAAAGTPVLVDSWTGFKNNFGDIQDGNHVLAHAVYGFFNNGGGECWITRLADPLTRQGVQDALEGLAVREDIALVAVPGATDKQTQDVIIAHCEQTTSRFAILDAMDGDGSSVPVPAQLLVAGHSSYGALYFPWLRVPAEISGTEELVPPSGHVAGVYARVDVERGVHKAPANEVLRGVLGVSTQLSRTAQGDLNVAGINVIRPIGTDTTIWGARTIDKFQPEYVTTRRMLIFLRGSIEAGLQWVVFEPNAMPLWARIERNVRAFLTTVWATGALFGETPAEAFFVHCDKETNTEIAQGVVITEIGVALVKPAEFVVFRISQLSGAGQ